MFIRAVTFLVVLAGASPAVATDFNPAALAASEWLNSNDRVPDGIELAKSGASGTTISGAASVIDGDTLEIRGQRIRLHGIDAPESKQLCTDQAGKIYRCGQQSALALSDLIGRNTVRCDNRGADRYRRIIAVCMMGATDLNEWLVKQGLAVAYKKYSSDYVAAENDARTAGRGVWRGHFDFPWDWRRKR